MEDMAAFLKRAAEKCGFSREYYLEKNMPTHHSNLVVLHFHGDTRSECILSSLILKRMREEMRASKYLIVCSWRGHRALFPYADEFWSVSDDTALGRLVKDAEGFGNRSDIFTIYNRNLNQYFESVLGEGDFSHLYDNGLSQQYIEKYQPIRSFLPMVPSSTILEARTVQEVAHRSGFKVFVMPLKYLKIWRQGRVHNFRVGRDFWDALLTRLESEGYTPVVCQNYTTHDLSGDHNTKCVFLREDDVGRIMAAMRMTGCVLDIFGGISRLACAARTPFVCCDDRQRFSGQKEYEIDVLTTPYLQHQYIFSFPTIVESGDKPAWETSIFDTVAARLRAFLPTIDRNNLPSTSESTFEAAYSVVRERKAKRIGAKFVRIPQD